MWSILSDTTNMKNISLKEIKDVRYRVQSIK